MYMVHTAVPAFIQRRLSPLHSLLMNKYFLDDFNEKILARGTRWLATGLWKGGDQGVIDGWIVNGSWHVIAKCASMARRLQTGFLYHYALMMILGMFGLVTWFVWIHH
jgi:NADH-quinone oxidoreductase subunit L